MPKQSEPKKIIVSVVQGPEGPSLYVSNLRVAGPKPWGGGKEIASWFVDAKLFLEDVTEAVDDE